MSEQEVVDRPHEIERTSTAYHYTTAEMRRRLEYAERIEFAAGCKLDHVVVRLRDHGDTIATLAEVKMWERAIEDIKRHNHFGDGSRPTQSITDAKFTAKKFTRATVCRDADGDIVDVLRGHHTAADLMDIVRTIRTSDGRMYADGPIGLAEQARRGDIASAREYAEFLRTGR
jgi:hypothetical protein